MDIRHDPFTRLSELSSIGLDHGAVARLKIARGMRLHVETGMVWITHDRGTDDVLVRSGETYAIARDGTTFVSSLGRRLALVTIESPAPAKPKPSFVERLGQVWCRLYVEPMPAPRAYL
jgi:hypothetical protein